MINDELKEYVKLAISRSDNDAHNYLLNYIGRDNLKNYSISLGAKNVLTGNDVNGYTTINDQIIFFKKIYSMTNENNED